MVLIFETKRLSVRFGTDRVRAYDRIPMASEWIERRKKELSNEAQVEQRRARQVEVMKAKAPDWMRRLRETLTLQVQEANIELGKKLKFHPNNDTYFAFGTELVYPALTVYLELDLGALCVRVKENRVQNSQSSQKEKVHVAELSTNRDDDLTITFHGRQYIHPEQFAAHVLEFAIYGDHPPRQDLGIS